MNEAKIERYIERMSEVENLTDGLEDDDASWLLEWGIDQLPVILEKIEDEEVAGEKVHQLMAAMRRLNQITADRKVKAAPDLAKDIQAFLTHYTRAFGRAPTLRMGDEARLAGEIKAETPLATLQKLLTFAESGKPTPPKR